MIVMNVIMDLMESYFHTSEKILRFKIALVYLKFVKFVHTSGSLEWLLLA